jgi:hypothetical protein
MRRREFIVGLGAAAWPLVGRAQQPTAMRRIGALMSAAADDPNAPVNIAAFAQGLQVLGWSIGTNVRIDYRWGAGQTDLYRSYAVELVALKPDVILAAAGSIVGALQQAIRGADRDRFDTVQRSVRVSRGPVAGLVGIEGGVVSGVFSLESPGVRAPGRRPRHDQRYHEA